MICGKIAESYAMSGIVYLTNADCLKTAVFMRSKPAFLAWWFCSRFLAIFGGGRRGDYAAFIAVQASYRFDHWRFFAFVKYTIPRHVCLLFRGHDKPVMRDV